MSRELQIIDALAKLSLNRREIDLESIRATVQRRQARGDLLPENWNQVARQALRTLAGLGMVQIESGKNGRMRYEKVRLTDQFLSTDAVRAARIDKPESSDGRDDQEVNSERNRLPSGAAVNTQGGGGRRGNGGDGFDEGDGGGEGFREVLAHPYLFSLSKIDFENILDQI